MIIAPSVKALEDADLPVGTVAWVEGVPYHRRAITGVWEAYPPEAEIHQLRPATRPKRIVKRRKKGGTMGGTQPPPAHSVVTKTAAASTPSSATSAVKK